MNYLRLPAIIAVATLMISGCTSLDDQSDWRWSVIGPTNPVDWSTSKASGLTPLSVNCTTLSGGDQHSLLAGVAGFKERSRNADRFIASLNVDCIKYVEFGGRYVQFSARDTDISTTTLTNNLTFRTSSGEIPIRLEGRQVPIGMIVYHHGKKYVMNLQIIWGLEENGVVSDYRDWSDNYTGATLTDYPQVPRLTLAPPFGVNRSRSLVCPSQNVIKGLRITQSSNGKIRSVGLDCQLLTNN